jgi:stress-induced morphogen
MRKLLIAPLLVLALLPAAAAQAADSHAPKGARLDWLPTNEWVMSAWLPYDESRLYATIDTSRDDLRNYLDDHRTLAALARQHGWTGSTRALALKLVQPRFAGVSKTMRHVLVQRALDTLTQAHLSRHVIFHVFHTPAIAGHAPSIFGVTATTYRRLRNHGTSPQTIGARGGHSTALVRSRLASVLRARDQHGAAVGAVSTEQAKSLWSEQQSDLAAYVTRAYRTSEQQIDFICHPH